MQNSSYFHAKSMEKKASYGDFPTSSFVSLSDINISLTVQYDKNCIPCDEGFIAYTLCLVVHLNQLKVSRSYP